MKTSELIEGLQILQKYRNEDGYDIGADHDVIFAYPTDKPVNEEDLKRLVELGWFQECGIGTEDEFNTEAYNDSDEWVSFT